MRRRELLTSIKYKTNKPSIPDNEIWYTTSDGGVIEFPEWLADFGANIISNSYVDGQGIISFDGPVTKIGDYVFDGQFTLTSIIIPDSVTTIRGYVFNNCSNLTSAIIGKCVTSIGPDAFGWCENLTSVYCKPMMPPNFSSTSIFAGSTSSLKIYVPTNSVGAYKSEIDWSKYADHIVGYDFEDDEVAIDTAYAIYYTSSDGNIVVPYDTNVFGANIVSNNYINGQGIITFDGPVTTIGKQAFWYRTKLRSVIIPGSVTVIGSAAFNSCDSLTRVIIVGSVTTIGTDAFSHCTSLTRINIPNSVTTIGKQAFWYCTSLKSIIIPNSITTIEAWTFMNCSSLTSVTIPESVTTIGGNAFDECTSLTSVYCKATTPPALGGTDVFDNNGSGRGIYVPTGSVNAYKSATNWSEYANDIKGY